VSPRAFSGVHAAPSSSSPPPEGGIELFRTREEGVGAGDRPLETRSLTVSLKCFGGAPTQAGVVVETLTLRRRVVRATT
jgi:hypothetical protein